MNRQAHFLLYLKRTLRQKRRGHPRRTLRTPGRRRRPGAGRQNGIPILCVAVLLVILAVSLTRCLHGPSLPTEDVIPTSLADIVAEEPDNKRAAAAALAFRRLGNPCFQELADQKSARTPAVLSVSRGLSAPRQAEYDPEEYLDCSRLVQWCYEQLDLSLPRTAAEQARYCEQYGAVLSPDALECGDLVFWSFEENGRYKNITHTGIYVGDGKIIDASYSQRKVAFRSLYSKDQIVLCGRILF